MSKQAVSRKRVLICNTGRCKGRMKVTPELRPKIEISKGGVHSLSVEDAGKCPVCGSDAGFVDLDAARFANDLSSFFKPYF